MTRSARARQEDISRALRAGEKLGKRFQVKIAPDGTIVLDIMPGDGQTAERLPNGQPSPAEEVEEVKTPLC